MSFENVYKVFTEIQNNMISKKEGVIKLVKDGTITVETLQQSLFEALAILEIAGVDKFADIMQQLAPNLNITRSELGIRSGLLGSLFYQFGVLVSFDKNLHPTVDEYKAILSDSQNKVNFITKLITKNEYFREKYLKYFFTWSDLVIPGLFGNLKPTEGNEMFELAVLSVLEPFSEGFIDGYESQLEEKTNLLSLLVEQ